ncbi:hypothetical protein A2526_04875 [candidate division WOR-1 bacterium RIFOXYD2_FULL_36_8]|uniref:Uncharacterized protein n=1 Tax=candidate division WOR-1 bacterium RIFOXYB2_FULL_36_35 TaxID=1802578 RepID=A0A1F4S3S7_UNCSA|nr:MAG: hypothetical protein A2230_09475 [candidate division WOR-1 bacterium RIFOXYA2_FULL_36_21]OGC15085.1 MAG: hypothetical protein A2290_09295 [candidate division WOR-1 bacterium RIFOXYB2_FULL_36_35]OGC16466.1 MAG: hypothetical protein A2282_03400 [candidate division WOR-1 bacterium RIFOXYA12_FULL_36_13]OGC41408.1 MAG: hypothetical protein A2526_04875 [candidate division WOR-1 bacterium RIFOXYD2_FULL_36_8]
MPSLGNELYVEINLEGTANVSNNRYFVIFSTMESYQIPLPPPDSIDEFLEPGNDPQPGLTTKESYYTKYYSTWNAYVVIDSFGYNFVKGPFVFGTESTREIISTLGSLTNKLAFKVNLEKIFGTNIPNNVYFDIVSVDYPTNSEKILKDRISPPVYDFATISGTVVTQSDIDDPKITTSLDIKTWMVRLE